MLLIQPVFPAYAGMILFVPLPEKRKEGVPRIRGDDPTFTREAGNYTPVFPAYAGMIPGLRSRTDSG